MEKPLVSIACTTYNHEKYIAHAIEGFLMQYTPFPIEIIIHDDASTDGTADIIRKLGMSHRIIKPIFQETNQFSLKKKPLGTYVIPQCRGKYIALCEGDDYWTDPYKLKKQVDVLESHPEFAMCFTNSSIVDGNNNIIKQQVC